MRLDKYLAQLHSEISRGKIQKAIKSGLVLVNGKKIQEADFEVTETDLIEMPELKEEELVAVNYDLKVVFENSDLVVLDKPAGIMVHPAAGRKETSLANALIAKYPDIKKIGDAHRPGIVHRLDEDTSGLLVVAKTAQAFDYLKALFAGRSIEKYYLTLVHGVPKDAHAIIDAPLVKSSSHQKVRVGPGREAKTEYWVLDEGSLGALQVSLLKVKLHTGRTHQIRVHMAHIGHPVFGDQLYGGQFKTQDLSILSRQFLHSYKLKFQLLDKTYVEVFSELPEDLKQVLTKANISYDGTKL